MNEPNAQFETPRLIVRAATSDDALLIVSLWSDPRVMRHVGFPRGIPTAADDVPPRIRRGKGLAALLIAEDRASRELIGQCMLGEPDEGGVCEPDVKLAPPRWGRGYGSGLWAAIIDQLFMRSTCAVVRGTPNVANVASIRMQEGAGMRRVGSGVFRFPDSMRAHTESVPYYVYEITRDEWSRRATPHPRGIGSCPRDTP
jgi:RimJ/RimL family protein N-acetyltransferase